MLIVFRALFVVWHESASGEEDLFDAASDLINNVERDENSAFQCIKSACKVSGTHRQLNSQEFMSTIHHATRACDPAIVWRGIHNDVNWLATETRLEGIEAAGILARSPLFLSPAIANQPYFDRWNAFDRHLRSLQDDWDVWINWYGPRIIGEVVKFAGTSNDMNSYGLAHLGQAFWNRPAGVVNRQIKELVYEQPALGDNDGLQGYYYIEQKEDGFATVRHHPFLEPSKSEEVTKRRISDAAPVVAGVDGEKLDALNGPRGGAPTSVNPVELIELLSTQRKLIEMVLEDLHRRNNMPEEVGRTLMRYGQAVSEPSVIWYLTNSLAKVVEANELQYRDEWPGDSRHYVLEVLGIHLRLRKHLDLTKPEQVEALENSPPVLGPEEAAHVGDELDKLQKDEELAETITPASALFLGHMATIVRSSDPAQVNTAGKVLAGYLLDAVKKLNQLGEKHKGLVSLLSLLASILKLFKFGG